MGYLVNPITYRLSKSKYWISSWNNITKKNLKNFFLEDNNLLKFYNWLKFVLQWKKLKIDIFNIYILKSYKSLILNFDVVNINQLYDIDGDWDIDSGVLKSSNDIVLYSSSKSNNFTYYFYNEKMKKINFFKKYNSNLLIFKRIRNNYISNDETDYSFSDGEDDDTNINFFFEIVKNFLLFLINSIFKIAKGVAINIFNRNHIKSSSKSIMRLLAYKLQKGYKIEHFVRLLVNNIYNDSDIIGFKLVFKGRYQKKLRNKKQSIHFGPIAPSNINTPISYEQGVVIMRYGVCGVKLYLLQKVYINEII